MALANPLVVSLPCLDAALLKEDVRGGEAVSVRGRLASEGVGLWGIGNGRALALENAVLGNAVEFPKEAPWVLSAGVRASVDVLCQESIGVDGRPVGESIARLIATRRVDDAPALARRTVCEGIAEAGTVVLALVVVTNLKTRVAADVREAAVVLDMQSEPGIRSVARNLDSIGVMAVLLTQCDTIGHVALGGTAISVVGHSLGLV